MASPDQVPSPERMRSAVAGYVQELHRAYVDQAHMFPPAVRGRMPLLAGGPLTVAAVATRNLHLLATHELLGPVRGPEVSVSASLDGLEWELRFYDSVVLPSLALLDEADRPAFAEVRHALGIGTVAYQVVASPGSGLSGHHAAHVGTGLANEHSSAARDYETIRARARGRELLVDEFAGAASAGLVQAQALLAKAIAPYDEGVSRAAADPDPVALRRALLASVGGRTQWTPPDAPAFPRDRADEAAATARQRGTP
jgi:hypothetical protein